MTKSVHIEQLRAAAQRLKPARSHLVADMVAALTVLPAWLAAHPGRLP